MKSWRKDVDTFVDYLDQNVNNFFLDALTGVSLLGYTYCQEGSGFDSIYVKELVTRFLRE